MEKWSAAIPFCHEEKIIERMSLKVCSQKPPTPERTVVKRMSQVEIDGFPLSLAHLYHVRQS